MVHSPCTVAAMVCILNFGFLSCADYGEQDSRRPNSTISTDQQLFTIITETEPFTSYTLFPRVDSVTSGTLNGSHAHQPLVRVSMNDTAVHALQDDRLPTGSAFPDGSIILKQITSGGRTVLYAVIYKDRNNPIARNGWLWAEFQTDGTPLFSIRENGRSCIECHSREQGPQNDFVRTFERQR